MLICQEEIFILVAILVTAEENRRKWGGDGRKRAVSRRSSETAVCMKPPAAPGYESQPLIFAGGWSVEQETAVAGAKVVWYAAEQV